VTIRTRKPAQPQQPLQPTLSTVTPTTTKEDFENFDWMDFQTVWYEIGKSHDYSEFISEAAQDKIANAVAELYEALDAVRDAANAVQFDIDAA